MKLLDPVLIISSAAVFGWLTASILIRFLFRPSLPKKIAGFSVTGMFPAMVYKHSSRLADGIALQVKAFTATKEQAILQQTRPMIEGHVDDFLKVKLKASFPLLHQFMGEKTFSRFKESFMEEVERLLPQVWKLGTNTLMDEANLRNMIKEKLEQVNWDKVEQEFVRTSARQIRIFKIKAACWGALIGCCQVGILYLSKLFI